MHTLLSIASNHLCKILPDDTSYKVTESYHFQNGIRLYRKELTSAIGLHNMDPLLSTYLMLFSFTLFAEESRPADSWVFSSNPAALNWLLMQQCGLRMIL